MTATEKDRTSYIVQGEYRVSRDPSEVLSTVLGSCVAVCLWDPAAKVGGMNHFLLPAAPGQGDAKMLRYGAHAMEVLINEVLKLGARRKALQAKLFGKVIHLDNGTRTVDGTGLIRGDSIGRLTWRSGVTDLIDTAQIKHEKGGLSLLSMKSYEQGRKAFEGTERDGVLPTALTLMLSPDSRL